MAEGKPSVDFETWMVAVDAGMMDIAGVTSDDIDDWEYKLCWEHGFKPRTAVFHALKAAGYPVKY